MEWKPAHGLVTWWSGAAELVLPPLGSCRRLVDHGNSSAWHAVAMSRTTGTKPAEIGPATVDDLPQIVEILNYTAAHSVANLVSEPTSVEERRAWFSQFSSAGPYRLLVARREGQVLGFAASQRYRELDAFRETVEVSISLRAECRGQGIGTALYRALFDSVDHEPVHVLLAGIALPNDASVALHRKFGFTEIGVFREYAVKNGQYISSLWMQRVASKLVRSSQGGAVSRPARDAGGGCRWPTGCC
ncbi:GNAT family N-acetyltransferase [Actinomadura madurae]|uniref:GNAT family N-acetyltransferase n=1 Tax=Actinomadura madurae TaxID=1993 RepID=UPI0027E390C0|nr:N-acetyltransferase family protein [Actinomadura madurae]